MQTALMTWYSENKRALPWRIKASPYRIWLSEIMCQQTRIDTAIPYYHRFLKRWPTVEALAAAELDEVLNAWAGLGYYSRARNLHKAAGLVAQQGGFPSDVKGLMELPGVGRYTAGAIASMAFGVDAPLVDGNVERVLSRHFGVELDLRSKEGKKRIWALADELLWVGRAGDWNQALMEWGALICHPKSPDCGLCPVRQSCVAFRDDRVDELPLIGKKTKPKAVYSACGVLLKGDKVLLRQRPPSGLLAGLWECPSLPFSEQPPTESDFCAYWQEEVGPMSSGSPRLLGTVKHVFSHRKLMMQVYAIPTDSSSAGDSVWVDAEEPGDSVALSRLTQKVLELSR